MPIVYQPDNSDSQSVALTFAGGAGAAVRIVDWISYDFSSDFLTPTDSFSFQLGVDESGLSDAVRGALKLGAEVQLHVESNILATGLIDNIEVAASRSGGAMYTIHGRDLLGQTLDTVADPTFHIKNGGTLGELLKQQLEPFGWFEDGDFVFDNDANRDARKGKRGTKTRKSSGTSSSTRKQRRKKTTTGPKPTSAELHQTKPYNHESVFHFCSRVAQRHGLWLWCTADGEQIVVGKPDFDQDPEFVLHRGRDGRGNILSGSVRYNLSEQPSIIIADGFAAGGSGEFGKGRVKSYIINPMLGLTDEAEPIAEITELLKKHPGAAQQTLAAASFAFRAANIPFRPMFLHDDESKTQEQLNAFVKREMSLMYRRAVTCSYVVEGHGQETEDGFVAWAPDTMVDVDDGVAELREQMYVLGVSFHKARGGGTTTHLELIRKNAIVF
jgi:prophage tail gpP-like protein